MPRTRPPYPPEFRAEAVRLVRVSGRPISQVARELGVSQQSLSSWVKQARVDDGEREGLTSQEREELRAARRRIRELETELAVHRRAAELLKEEVRPKGALRRSR